MKSRSPKNHKSFQYNYDKKRITEVDFDILEENGKKVVKNIILTSNWRVYYPKNPKIRISAQGEYGFFEDGILSTNGDIQQIIKRIHQMVEEATD
ncbi:hypothetical protein ACMA1I_02305 [Pontibacter sp. 13R65]|uniref:hypothetical protein n=1 Tax=Pontibacter sp. 13R65 TaxID=3127458 RepID=UPI00301C08BD